MAGYLVLGFFADVLVFGAMVWLVGHAVWDFFMILMILTRFGNSVVTADWFLVWSGLWSLVSGLGDIST